MSEWWEYANLEPMPEEGYDWSPATKGNHSDDQIDFHIDLGAGTVPKGRLAIDRYGDVDIKMNLDTGIVYDSREPFSDADFKPPFYKGLPFPDESIESIISHHCLEHIGYGFIDLMDECYRILKSRGIFRIIVPLFPSFTAIEDPDHCRYFCKNSFESFVHDAPPEVPFWTESFSVPYTKSRFKLRAKDYTRAKTFNNGDAVDIDKLFEEPREIRVTLQKP
jgi:SAM-dependent methyltransferase